MKEDTDCIKKKDCIKTKEEFLLFYDAFLICVKRIEELEKALEYAISQADMWYDNNSGMPLTMGVIGLEMDAAREILAKKNDKPDFDGLCVPGGLWPHILLASTIGTDKMPTRFKNAVKNGLDIFDLKGLHACGSALGVSLPEFLSKNGILE